MAAITSINPSINTNTAAKVSGIQISITPKTILPTPVTGNIPLLLSPRCLLDTIKAAIPVIKKTTPIAITIYTKAFSGHTINTLPKIIAKMARKTAPLKLVDV